MTVAADPRVGTELAGYRIEALLGRGGMSDVYLAQDLRLKRKVALKLLAPDLARDERFRERFLRESELAASIDHPSITPIYEAGEVEGLLYIAMRYVEGSDLKSVIAKEGRLEPRHAVAVLDQVADALDAAHERDLVHRDVKPGNILIATAREGREHVYLSDFGLTKHTAEDGSLTESGQFLGTIDYVAPEQIEGGEIDGRTDVYSLGCVLYECLAGRVPYSGGSKVGLLFAHLQKPPPSLVEQRPELPAAIDGVIARAMAKSPDDRYPTCRGLLEEARSAFGLSGEFGRPFGSEGEIASVRVAGSRRRWLLAVAVVGVALIVAALLAFFLTRGESGVQAEPDADTLVRIDPTTDKIVSSKAVGRAASGVAVGDRYVWVTSFSGGTLWRIDTHSGDTLKIPVRGSPTGVAASPGGVLVANSPEHSLAFVDPSGDAVSYNVQLPGAVSGTMPVAPGAGAGWFADAARRVVGVPLPAVSGGGTTTAEIHVPADEIRFLSSYEGFSGLAVGEGAVWAAGDAFGRTVWRLDPAALRVVASIELPFVPGSIAAGEGGVWVTSLLEDTVARIDPATNRIVATIPVDRGVGAIAAGNGAVWVASTIDRVVSRIDPRTNRVVHRVPLARTPTQIAVGAGGVWVTTAEPAPVVPRGTIGIGVVADCTGAFGAWYDQQIAGAELVLLEHGARRAGPRITDGIIGAQIAGKPVTLALGCSDGTSASLLSEARRLVEQVGVHVLIGPTYASEELALLEYVRRQPEIAFVNGLAGAQVLDRPPNFFSFTPSVAQDKAGLGTYAYRTLGWRRAVTVGDLDLARHSWAEAAGFIAEFCSLGGAIVERIWVPPGTQDYSDVVDQIPTQGVDGIVALTRPQTVAALANAYPGLSGNASRKLILGGIAWGPELDELFARSPGIASSSSNYARDDPAGREYLADTEKHFPNLPSPADASYPGDAWGLTYYNAMAATVQALLAVDGDLSDGARRFMAALARVELDSPGGPIRLDPTRQAVVQSHIGRISNGVWDEQSFDGVEHTFNGYFTADDPPPGPTTPECKRHKPPPWAQ